MEGQENVSGEMPAHFPPVQVRPEQHSLPVGQFEPLEAHETVMEQEFDAECDALSVAETETDELPIADAAGVPLIELPEEERPEGRPVMVYE